MLRRLLSLSFGAVVVALSGWHGDALALSAAEPASVPVPALERGLPVLRNFLPRDYRGHSQIWKILETRDGVMLFGNLQQVVEFDGLNWNTIPVPGGSYIRAMAADATGTIWLAGVNELGRLVRNAEGRLVFESFRARVPADLGDLGAIWHVHALADGVYFQGNTAVLRWDGAKFDVWQIPGKSTVGSFPFGETLIVARSDGWFVPRPGGTWEQVGDPAFGEWLPRFFLPQADGGWLVGHGIKGLYDFKAGTLSRRPTEIENWLTSKKLFSGTRLPDGRYLFTSLQGGAVILSTDLKFETLLDESSGLVTQTVITSYLDRHGALWLGTDRGICRIELNSPVTVFGQPHNLGRNGPETLRRSNGQVMISGDRSVLGLEPAATLPGHAQFRPVLKDGDRFIHFHPRPDGMLASGLTGLHWIAEGRQTSLGGPSGIREVVELTAQPGRYVATHLNGIASWRYAAGQWRFEGDWPEVQGELRGLVQDRDGALWVSTLNDGVRRIEPAPDAARAQKVERFADAEGLPSTRNRAWIGLVGGAPLFFADGGMFRFDARTRRFVPETRFGPEVNRPGTYTRNFAEDRRGGLWLANEPRDDAPTQLLYARDGRATPLPLTEITDINLFTFLTLEQPRGQDILWIGGQSGLRQVDLTRWREQPSPPIGPTLLRAIHAGQDRRLNPESKGIRLAASENSVRFTFGTPGLAGESESLHETKLLGFEAGEVQLARAGERTFTNLPSGNYTFEVRGRSADGRWSDPAVFAFTVLPPWLAWSAYAGLAGVSLFFYVRWRVRRLTRERTRLEGIVAERTTELARKNSELERLNRLEHDEKITALLAEEKARLEMLRYQLNPHFLFNSLNSIRALVHANPALADEMVTRLAEFCRQTLTRGDDELTTVTEEIELLRTYLDIEKARWQDALQIQFDVDPVAAARQLPQFLLLPLIENAIKYGSQTSAAILQVRITVRLEGTALFCAVANTGRWLAPEPRPRATSAHIGLDNLRERLARHYGPACVYNVDASQPGWVHVSLTLPERIAAPLRPGSPNPFT